MEKQKISIKYYVYFVIGLFLILVSVLSLVTWVMPVCTGKADKYFNTKQESADERFIAEYSGILNVYHDNELNVTCWETCYSGVGLFCIPDAEIERR